MHFYTETINGVEPRHFVAQKSDPSKTRASRVSDAKAAKKSGEVWYASVTSVLGILDKPALLNWKIDKHLEQAYAVSQDKSFDEYINIVKAKTSDALDSAPQAGTDIHKILEDWLFENREFSNLTEVEKLICFNIEKELSNRINGDILKEQYFINKDKGYAGCADLVCNGWIIDYKSKQEKSKFIPGKMAYPEHYRQLSAYGKAFFKDAGFRAANIFICLETGEIDFHEHKKEDLDNGWLDFLDCLSLYKRNNYDESKL